MESVEKSKNAMETMGNFIPMRMCMNLDRLWVEIMGNSFPQVIHPQSTGSVDKFYSKKELDLQILNVFYECFNDIF